MDNPKLSVLLILKQRNKYEAIAKTFKEKGVYFYAFDYDGSISILLRFNDNPQNIVKFCNMLRSRYDCNVETTLNNKALETAPIDSFTDENDWYVIPMREFMDKIVYPIATNPEKALSEIKQENEDITVKTCKEWLKDGIPQVKWIIDKLIAEGGVTFFAGTSGCSKTWLAIEAAIAVANGEPFAGAFNSVKRKVLYIDEENGETALLNRVGRILKGKNLPLLDDLLISIYTGIVLDGELGCVKLTQLVTEHMPSLIIIDSLVRVMDGDENKATDIKRIFANIRPILKEGVGVLILHHTAKTNGSTMAGVRGSSDLPAQATVVAMIQKGTNSYFYMDIVKDRHGVYKDDTAFYYSLEDREGGGVVIDWKGQRPKVDEVDSAANNLYDYLQGNNISQFKATQVAKKCKIKRDSFYKALTKLIESKKVVKLSWGNYQFLDATPEEQID